MCAVGNARSRSAPIFCASSPLPPWRSALPAKRSMYGSSRALSSETTFVSWSPQSLHRPLKKGPLWRATHNGKRAANHPVPATGRPWALRDISVADPAGNDVQADQRWNLEVIAGFGALRGASHSPLPRARHGNSVKVTAKKPGVWPPRASFRWELAGETSDPATFSSRGEPRSACGT